jgi:hypothetical protein
MYKVQLAGHSAGRPVVVVRDEGRLISGASVDFVNWMSEKVPSRQLRPEQLALVKWTEKRSAMSGERIGFGEH